MSEHWKSTPKYWCKHCSAYVKDTPFERKQHESTAKHQGNLKRSLRSIQNEHERGEREKEKAKAEVDRLNRVVNGSTSSSGPLVQNSSTARKTAAGSLTATDQKRQWAQLAEMGIQVPDNFRAEMAMPGQWQTTSKPVDDALPTENLLSIGVRKRKAGDHEDEAEASEAVQQRGWGAGTKRYPEQSDADLDALLNGSLIKKEVVGQLDSHSQLKNLLEAKHDPECSASEGKVVKQELEDNIKDQRPLENVASVPNQPDARTDSAGLETTSTLLSIPPNDETPLFKKRKVKIKTDREKE